MTINSYPLQWPMGWKRASARKDSRFSTSRNKRSAPLSVMDGVERVLIELDRMGYGRDDIVISTNVPTRLDGLPRSGTKEPDDPGAAVYWRTRKGEHKVMAIDVYDRVADNLAAVAATLDAMRAIKRHGGAAILDRAFTGFTALPAPAAARSWWDVLEVSPRASNDEITAAYRRLRSLYHPDKGGTAARFDEIEQAYRKATS